MTPEGRLPLNGAEAFVGSSFVAYLRDATVSDFWAFAMSDLRVNNVRGYLAEFVVARALGTIRPRMEWDDADVLTSDGVRVEVKAGGYLQAWRQRGPSRVTFTGLRGRTLA